MATKLKDWQKAIVDIIHQHEDLINSEEYISLADFSKNDLSKVRVSLPKGSGHTFLTAYLATKMPTAVIYKDIEHYHQIRSYMDKINSENVSEYQTAFLSVFELYFILASKDNSADEIEKVKSKIQDKAVVVIDRASSLVPSVEDFILNVSRGKVVLLD